MLHVSSLLNPVVKKDPQTQDSREIFLKNLPPNKVHGLIHGVLFHASNLDASYEDRAQSFDTLCILIQHHPLEVIKYKFTEPILREASKVIVLSAHHGPIVAPLLRSAGAAILAMGHQIEELFPLLLTLINEYFPSNEASRRQCAMILIGMCIRSFGDRVISISASIWEVLVSGIHDEAPAVCEAACFSLGFWASNPTLVADVSTRCSVIIPTILSLCWGPLTNLAACSIILPLLAAGGIQGEDHNLMIISFDLLKNLPNPFKYLSLNVMGYVAMSLGGRFLPYLSLSMRRLQDFAFRCKENEPTMLLAILCATSCFANAVGRDAFHPYLEDVIGAVLHLLCARPPVHIGPSLTFIGVMSQIFGEGFSQYLPAIVNAISTIIPYLAEGDEETLAKTIRHLVESTQIDFLHFVPIYIDTIKRLLFKQNPTVQKAAIHTLFSLIAMLQKIEVKAADELQHFSLEAQAKEALLNADISNISFLSQPGDNVISSDRILSLDFILGDLDGSLDFFPVSKVLFTKAASGRPYSLDMSSYIPVLISRCRPSQSPRVEIYAFATLAHILTTVDDVSWSLIETWVSKLLPILCRRINQGEPNARPAAIRALGRLVHRTRLDLVGLYPCLLNSLHGIINTNSPTLMVHAAASTLSLLAIRNPKSLEGTDTLGDLVNVLSTQLDLEDTLLVFEAFRAVLTACSMPAMPSILEAVLQSYGSIVDDLRSAQYCPKMVKEITRCFLDIITGDRDSNDWVGAVDFSILFERLKSRYHTFEFSREFVSHVLDQSRLNGCPEEAPNAASLPPTNGGLTVTKIPPETIAKIISFCLPKGRDWDLAGAAAIPRNIAQINCVWRQVALHTPTIWNQLDIELVSGFCDEISGPISTTIDMWLTRSVGLPVSISIRCLFDDPAYGSYTHVNRLACAILPFSCFWRDIHLHFPVSTVQYFHQAYQRHCALPQLRFFSLTSSGFAPRPHQTIFSLYPAPALRILDLHDTGLKLQTLEVPWNQLTDLRLRVIGWKPQECMDMLSSCKHLRHLSLTGQANWQHQYAGSEIFLPYLRVIRLSHGLSQLVVFMNLPHLREMRLQHLQFSLALTWAGGGFAVFLTTLKNLRQQGIASDALFESIRLDRQAKIFRFVIMDSSLLASAPPVDMIPNIAIYAQCVKTMELDCSACPDQAIGDLALHILCTVNPASTCNIMLLTHRGIGKELEKRLSNICEGYSGVVLNFGNSKFEAHISKA